MRDKLAAVSDLGDGLWNVKTLLQRVDVEALAEHRLNDTAEWVKGEPRITCPFCGSGKRPTLGLLDDYNGSGVGRLSCLACGWSGDAINFLETLMSMSNGNAPDDGKAAQQYRGAAIRELRAFVRGDGKRTRSPHARSQGDSSLDVNTIPWHLRYTGRRKGTRAR
jgi:hypothetical protein